jgi:putative nucleotidyltransferase with HDIG domain
MKLKTKPIDTVQLKAAQNKRLQEPERSDERVLDDRAKACLRVLFDAFPFYVLLISEKHQILLANKMMAQHLGIGLEEIVGHSCTRVVHGISGSFPGCPLEEAVEKGTAVEREFFDNTSKRWVKSAVYPTDFRTLRGQTVYAHFTSDITRQKKAEEVSKQTFKMLRKTFDETVRAMASTVEKKDPYTAGHQRRVAQLAYAIARNLNLPEDKVTGLRVAATLHDIGKMYIPVEILNKPGRLSDLEMTMIKTHSQAGHELTERIPFPWDVALIILQHHERMDGSGYPHSLRGPKILMEARILAVADVVEAMASHRPYRPALGVGKALEEIRDNKGILYDPDVVDACLRAFEQGFRFE